MCLSVAARLVLEHLKAINANIYYMTTWPSYMTVLAARFDVLIHENVKSSGASV